MALLWDSLAIQTVSYREVLHMQKLKSPLLKTHSYPQFLLSLEEVRVYLRILHLPLGVHSAVPISAFLFLFIFT